MNIEKNYMVGSVHTATLSNSLSDGHNPVFTDDHASDLRRGR